MVNIVLDELKEGNFVINNGVISTVTPLTTIEKIEKEILKEIEGKIKRSKGKEIIVKMLGSAVEFFTDNGWKINYIDSGPNSVNLTIAAPFNGGVMKGTDRNTEEIYEIYIPSGYLAMKILCDDFPHISSSTIILLPNLKGVPIKELCKKYYKTYYKVHPHYFPDGKLCHGLSITDKFDLNIIVAQIEACIKGSQNENRRRSSILDYNAASPALPIHNCTKSIKAFKLHEKGVSDEKIWEEILSK